jgi:hypothetical protein
LSDPLNLQLKHFTDNLRVFVIFNAGILKFVYVSRRVYKTDDNLCIVL